MTQSRIGWRVKIDSTRRKPFHYSQRLQHTSRLNEIVQEWRQKTGRIQIAGAFGHTDANELLLSDILQNFHHLSS